MPVSPPSIDKKRVCVIGAGVSGLVTAKVFLGEGHDVDVFEQIDTLGGVWAPARRYPGVCIQIPRDCYAYSDFPMPSGYPLYPSGEQIYAYLDAYARRFGVAERIRCRTEVVRLAPRPDGRPGWRVHLRDLERGEERADDYDFVVVCNGIFSAPAVPDLPGRDAFEASGGIVLHSSQHVEPKALEGRAVAVVGFGKSAVDLAEASLARATRCALIARRIVWKIPRRIWGRLSIKYLMLSRFTEVWLPHPEMGGVRRFLHRWLKPVVDGYWWMSERIVARQLGFTEPRLRPDVPLRAAIACVGLAPADDFKALREGRIALHRAGVARFVPEGLVLDNGETVPAQTVVFATGFRQQCPFLPAREAAALFDAKGAMQLYRLLVNPDIPALGFTGYNGFGAVPLSSEVGAVWLAMLMAGRIALPERAAMVASIADEIALRARLVTSRLDFGFFANPFTFGYLDQVMRDLGLPPADRGKPFFKWLFEPIEPRDYRGLAARADAALARPAPAGQPQRGLEPVR